MIRWGATVTGSTELQAYYLIACNENLNKKKSNSTINIKDEHFILFYFFVIS